jgi:hypothetical protein
MNRGPEKLECGYWVGRPMTPIAKAATIDYLKTYGKNNIKLKITLYFDTSKGYVFPDAHIDLAAPRENAIHGKEPVPHIQTGEMIVLEGLRQDFTPGKKVARTLGLSDEEVITILASIQANEFNGAKLGRRLKESWQESDKTTQFATIFPKTPSWQGKGDKKNTVDNSGWVAKWEHAVVEVRLR